MVIARRGGGVHEVLDEGRLTLDEGLVGDRWSLAKDPERGSQITLMTAGVIEAIQPGGELVPTSGDNFLVDLDLSEEALPGATRLSIGTAVVEVTDEPHTGCKKFTERFGSDALRWINGRERRERRLRGIHCRVIDEGVVRPGDVVKVVGA